MSDELPVEHLMRIRLRGTDVAALLCTPERMDDLATGWLFSQGVSVPIDARVIRRAVPEGTEVEFDLAVPASLTGREFVVSGLDACVLQSGPPVQVSGSASMTRDRFEREVVSAFDTFRRLRGSGGYHHAALIGDGGVLDVVRDLSRHNAVDKIVGGVLRTRVDASQSAIVLSGRITADIALKSARLGVPVVASRSLPTAQAVALAEATGLMVVARVLDHRRVVFGRNNLREPKHE